MREKEDAAFNRKLGNGFGFHRVARGSDGADTVRILSVELQEH
jgi:hypothetical protein